MTIRTLSDIPFDDILACFLSAFKGYFVKMPTDRYYYEKRWKAAKVNFNYSYGMFDGDQLVGFLIHAIDKRAEVLTAFNTGTGVIPAYRGKRVVKSLYHHALYDLRQKRVKKSTLEVITENHVAIRAYESVGFTVCKKYECYAGHINVDDIGQFEVEEIALKDICWQSLPNQQYYSWDFQKETVSRGNYTFFQVLYKQRAESFFIINRENQYVAQFDLLHPNDGAWLRLFSAVKRMSSTIKIINLDSRLTEKRNTLQQVGLEHLIDQYEMELTL